MGTVPHRNRSAGFARFMKCDLDAVTAGLILQYSSGAVEGHVKRIQMIEPQEYGRPSFQVRPLPDALPVGALPETYRRLRRLAGTDPPTGWNRARDVAGDAEGA
ncbi:hypothetical protein ACGFYQ_37545 [Streptomyces sp. NPDC048258]|uniref:hypothetical protein n=1 Tax=Streptomyces sp. NPDC048258 TaxID=3365527 RepID=UPI003721A7C4